MGTVSHGCPPGRLALRRQECRCSRVVSASMVAGRRHGRNGSSGFGGLVALLIVVSIIVKFIWWILGFLALVVASFVIWAVLRERQRRRQAAGRYRREVAARADAQHNWVLQGDDRGFYGPQGARLMHDIGLGAPTVRPDRWSAQ